MAGVERNRKTMRSKKALERRKTYFGMFGREIMSAESSTAVPFDVHRKGIAKRLSASLFPFMMVHWCVGFRDWVLRYVNRNC